MKHRSFLREKITPFSVFSCFALLCVLFAIVFSSYAVLKREHPEKVAHSYALCVENNDAKGYAALLYDEYTDFMIRYMYYTQEDFEEALKSQLLEMNEFYAEKCGDDFTIKYKVANAAYADEKQMSEINAYYRENLFYENEIEKASKLKVTFDVSGKEGRYTTIITDFICLKIDNVWYFVPDFPCEGLLLDVE